MKEKDDISDGIGRRVIKDPQNFDSNSLFRFPFQEVPIGSYPSGCCWLGPVSS